MRIAALDLGTNTFHLMIVNRHAQGWTLLEKHKQVVNLGKEDTDITYIHPQAEDRAWKALTFFHEKIQHAQVHTIRAVATSAFRNARNGAALATRMQEHTGIPIDIVSGEEEALLIYHGVKAILKPPSPALIMDLGGGSVEFICFDAQTLYKTHSLEVGAQRLFNRFHHADPIAVENIHALQAYLKEALSSVHKTLQEHTCDMLIGTSGTFNTLCNIHLQAQGIRKDKTKKYYTLPLSSCKSICQQIIQSSRAQRLQIPGMAKERVDTIVTACLLVDHVLTLSPISHVKVSSYALKEGLFLSPLSSSR